MKTLKRIGLALLLIIILLIVTGFFLPKQVHVERSIVVNAPAEVSFALVNDLTQWKQWSAWHKMDSLTNYEFSTPPAGIHSWFVWNSKVTGKGKMTLSDVKEYDYIKAKLEFDGYDASSADFFFKETDGTTKITWTMDSDMGYNPVGRWFGLFMDGMIGKDFETGLVALKILSESTPVSDKVAGFDVDLRKIPEQKYLFIESNNVQPEEISIQIGEAFLSLDAYFKQNNYTLTSHPFTIWTDRNNFISAFPITEDAKPANNIKLKTDAAFTAYVVKYYGAYDKPQPVYDAIHQFLTDKQVKPAGPPREIYITDPVLEKDTAKWLTEIVFPINQ